jgi:hypothetical protein
MNGGEKRTIPKFSGLTEVRNIGEIYREKEDRGRKPGDSHISNHMVNMMNRESDFRPLALAARLDVL